MLKKKAVQKKKSAAWIRFPIWDSWKHLTRTNRVIDLTLSSYLTTWSALPIPDKDQVQVTIPTGKGTFKIVGTEFVNTLADRHFLGLSILIASYALIETFSEDTAVMLKNKRLVKLNSGFTQSGGIETWGKTLLSAVKRDWTEILDGKAGLVETATIRNALAHGQKTVTRQMENRCASVGGTLPWKVNQSIVLQLPMVEQYRDRLRSFGRVIAGGASELLA